MRYISYENFTVQNFDDRMRSFRIFAFYNIFSRTAYFPKLSTYPYRVGVQYPLVHRM